MSTIRLDLVVFPIISQSKANALTIILCSDIKIAIIIDYPTSSPLIPAYILIELVQNIPMSIIYTR